MKTTLVVWFILVLATVMVASPVESRITAVTVYPDRAVVTRTATVELTPGTHELAFAQLPATLNERTVQVSGRGVDGATILDVGVRQSFVDHAASPRVKELEEKLRDLQRALRRLDDRAAVLADQGKMIDRMEAALLAPPGPEVDRPEIEQLKTSGEFITTQRTRLMADRTELQEEREALQARITAVQHQLNELRGSGSRAFKTMTVRVAAEQAGALALTFSYTVPQARWSPGYDVRFTGGERVVELGYFGLVRQNTGEDWTDVALTLSTARPSLGGAAPDLAPWHLDVWVERPPVPVAAAPAPRFEDMARTRVGTSVAMNQALAMEAKTATAEVEAATTSVVFRVRAPATLLSDNTPQRVPITALQLNQLPEYRTTPKLAATAYLTARVMNTSDYPLLAGEMSVFLDGTFVATSRIDTVMPEEQFDIALGADEGIAVEHREIQRFTEQIGLRSRTTRVTHEYLITVQNNKRSAERVVVLDQVPLSRHDDIVVRVLEPAARELQPDNKGELNWLLMLQPEEKRELRLKFTVEYPNDTRVTGLE